MRLIQYNTDHLQNAQPLPGIMPPITVSQFRGVNTYDPFQLDDSFLTDMSNMVTDDFPTLTVRPGYTVLGSAIGTKVLGIGVWKDTELHAVFNDGTWRKWNGSAWTTLTSGLSTTAEWSFTNFQGSFADINLIGSNGVDAIKTYNGSTVVNLSGAPAGGNFITTYQNRLWCAVGIEVMSCALDQPTVWNDFSGDDSDSYVKTMESTRGENVNMLSGSLSKLTIGMPNSLHELYGGVPSDFMTRLVTEDTGVESNKSAFVHDAVLRLIHKNGIYEFVSGGVSPDRSFSDVVKGYLSNTNSSSAATDGKKYYFFTDGRILIYDPRLQTWCVWRNITPTSFARFKGDLYIGDATGRVLKLGGTTDGGVAIPWYAITKPFTNGSVAQKTRWLKMFTHWELAAGSTLNIYLSDTKDGNDWDLVYSVTGTGEKIDRIMVPIGQFVLSNMVRIKFEGTGWAKMYEHTRQVRQMPLY